MSNEPKKKAVDSKDPRDLADEALDNVVGGKRFKDSGKEIESQDRLDNFEIQRLLS